MLKILDRIANIFLLIYWMIICILFFIGEPVSKFLMGIAMITTLLFLVRTTIDSFIKVK